MNLDLILFFAIGAGAIIFALLTVLLRNPVMSAISLIANFFCIALLYLLLQAQLLAVLQIVIYTGAIMVLVVFVIMLLNLGNEEKMTVRYDFGNIAAVVIAAGFGLEMLYIFFSTDVSTEVSRAEPSIQTGTVEAIGTALFGTFLLPFEVTSILLLAAIVGAVVLARRKD